MTSPSTALTILTVSLDCRDHFLATAASLPGELPPWLQWIVVDGGSTDGTVEAVSTDPRVSAWISEKDRGVYDAYNKAWQMASSPFVLYLNCGDVLAEGALESLAAFVTGPGKDRDDTIHCYAVAMAYNSRVWTPAPEHLREGMSVPTPGVIFPRTSLEWTGGFDSHLRVASDYEVLLRLKLAGRDFAVHPEVLVRYLGGGISTRLEHLGFFEECAIQLRCGAQSSEQVLLRAARRAVTDIDHRSLSFLRWRLAIALGKKLLY